MTREQAEQEAAKRELHKSKFLHEKRWSAEHSSVRGWHVALVDKFVSRFPVPAASAHPALANAQSATEAGGRKDLAS